MSNYEDLLGLPYIAGRNDCFSIVREYLRRTYGVEVPNYARPDRFWEDPRLNLYGMYGRHGFVSVMDQKLQIGDVLLMPIRTPVNSHAVVLVDDNTILHHFPGQLSTVEPLRPRWLSRATVVLRHPRVTEVRAALPEKLLHEVVDVRLFQSPGMQKAIERAMEIRRGAVRGDPRRPAGGDAEQGA